MAITEVGLSKNQDPERNNELDVEGEARLYRALRHFWHPVIWAHEVPDDTPVKAMLCGENLVVARLEGQICVFNDLCAHRGSALSLGHVVRDGTVLRCIYHGWQYNKDGRCVLAPQRPDLSDHLRARIKKYNAVEAYGQIWVCLEDEPALPLPEFPMYDDRSFTRAYLPCDDWNCSAPRRTENYCDISHLAFVHDGILGSMDHPAAPEHRVWREGNCVRIEAKFVEHDAPETGPGEVASAPDVWDGNFSGVLDYYNYMPLTVRIEGKMDAGFTYVLFFHPTPIGPKTTRNFTVGASNLATDDPEAMAQEIIDFQRTVYNQDKPVVESQRPEHLPEDLSWELYLKGVDGYHLEYRRWLVELTRELVPA